MLFALKNVPRIPLRGLMTRTQLQELKPISNMKFDSAWYQEQMHHYYHHKEAAGMWQKVVWFACVPLIVGTSLYMFLHVEPERHKQIRPEFVEYPHRYRHKRDLPWGDGKHTLFHNPAYNALPGVGYEVSDPALEHGH